MWLIANRTAFAADYAWVLDRDSNKHWLVVVKASFDIQPDGRCRLAAHNEPIVQLAEPYGELGRSSLRSECDLLGVKPLTDVLVRGSAMAPGGRSTTSVDVALRVGGHEKRLRVTGDRHWERTLTGALRRSDPIPFDRMPIVYERAHGGWDRSSEREEDHRLDVGNPVGMGFLGGSTKGAGLPVPNVEALGPPTSSRSEGPAGFGVIDSAWSPRRERAGTYDERWRRDRFPMWAADYDARYVNCAPDDQQFPYLAEGARIEVENMSEQGLLSFEVPKVRPFFCTRFGSDRVEHAATLCTVIVDPNEARLTLVWQTSLQCNRRADELDETLVVERSTSGSGVVA